MLFIISVTKEMGRYLESGKLHYTTRNEGKCFGDEVAT